MTTTPLIAAALATLTTLLTPHILTALPIPAGEHSSPYTQLATRRVAVWMGSVCGAMSWLVLAGLPAWCWPVWLVLSTVGGVAVCIDELTCWLPRVLTSTATGLVLGALGISWISGLVPGHTVLRSLLAGAITRGFFWLMWRVVGGLGFGDVRLALLCGLCAGMLSWPAAYLAALLGTVIPLILRSTIHRGEKIFAYGPGLLAGALLAGVVSR